MSYSKSHVILIAFAIDTPDSLENVTVKVRVSSHSLALPSPPSLLLLTPGYATQWIEEVRSICGPQIPVILVGCKSDLRPPSLDPASPLARHFVSRAEAERVAQAIGARAYKECSALKIEGVDDVFEAATRASMLMREGAAAPGHGRRRSGDGRGRGDGEWEGKGGCCVVL